MHTLTFALGAAIASRAMRHHDLAEGAADNPGASHGISPKKLLVAVNGSEHGQHAVRYAIRLYRQYGATEIHLLNVQETSQSPRVHAFYSHQKLRALEEVAGEKALQTAQRMLDEAGVTYVSRVEAGPVAQTIASYAATHGCDAIVMGTSGHGAVASLIIGNVPIKVIHLTDIPVTLVK